MKPLIILTLALRFATPAWAADKAGHEKVCTARLERLASAAALYADLYQKPPAKLSELYYTGMLEDTRDAMCPASENKPVGRRDVDEKGDFTLDKLGDEIVVRERKPHHQTGKAMAVTLKGEKKWIDLSGSQALPTSAEGVQIPSVGGITAREAKTKLLSAGFTRVTFLVTDEDPPAKDKEFSIQKQDPPAGTRAKLQTPVTLYVYSRFRSSPVEPSESPTAEIPKVVGLPAKDAKTKLASAGFTQVTFLVTDEDPPSKARELTVQKQDPPAGTPVKAQTPITVYIYPRFSSSAAGPAERDTVEVADVVGLTAKAAKAELAAKGLAIKIQAIDEKPLRREQEFTVKGQSPEAGTKVKPGTAVTVQIYLKFE